MTKSGSNPLRFAFLMVASLFFIWVWWPWQPWVSAFF